jgi:peptidoglycan-associated lipoprotein
VGGDYLVAPNLSIHAEVGWKLNDGKAEISTTSTTSKDSYKASSASFQVGVRYFFPKPKRKTKKKSDFKPAPSPDLPIAPTITPEIAPVEPIKETPRQESLFRDILFESNSYEISLESEEVIEDTAHFLKSYPDIPIEIAGHTDSHGSSASNLETGKKRAEAVKAALQKIGVTNTIGTVSYGETRPADPTPSPISDRLNRRVTIKRLDQ